MGTSDADILVTFSVNNHQTAKYVHDLRISLAKEFPGVTFSFLPSDMVTQILNFGLPAPIDIQVVGNDLQGNQAFANALLEKVKYVSGIADARIQQRLQGLPLFIIMCHNQIGRIISLVEYNSIH